MYIVYRILDAGQAHLPAPQPPPVHRNPWLLTMATAGIPSCNEQSKLSARPSSSHFARDRIHSTPTQACAHEIYKPYKQSGAVS